MIRMFTRAALVLTLGIPACAQRAEPPVADSAAPATETITAVTTDGVTIYGEPYFDGLDSNAPLVLLFHQAGGDGRGEYADLVPALNAAGFRAIAWDQRAGGDRFGGVNRTAEGLAEGTPAEYCDAYPDLVAALDAVTSKGLAEKVIVWGSSYSAALVFRLAAEHPDRIAGVVACSPAAGGPMVDCRAREWLGDVSAPILVLRPASEMENEGSIEQRGLFVAAGADFRIIENGVHGSSMLIDSRTGEDMSGARTAVVAWLRAAAGTRL
jgi:pimeloyl-ACP methyl ester carboxylesterase